MDLEGNRYPCHNTSQKIDTIHMLFFQYLQRVLAGDPTMRHLAACLDCPAVSCCKGGCKLVLDKAREETYCKLKQALIMPVIQAFEECGRRVGGKVDGS